MHEHHCRVMCHSQNISMAADCVSSFDDFCQIADLNVYSL